MKTPNGRYVTIHTNGWQDAFDRIISRMTTPMNLVDMMSRMHRELDVPADERGVINPYLATWLKDAVGRSSDIQMVTRNNAGLIKKPSYEREPER